MRYTKLIAEARSWSGPDRERKSDRLLVVLALDLAAALEEADRQLAEAGTRADLIAELAGWGGTQPGTIASRCIAALEEADRQLAEAREDAATSESDREDNLARAEAAEAALKVATDALEEISTQVVPGTATRAVQVARAALAAIRQKEEDGED